MLPVITVKMSGKDNRRKQGNVLIDSGAQISLICTSMAKSLGLTGKDVSITLKQVGGEEDALATKVYQVPITVLESGVKFTVRAVGIPQICDDISKSMSKTWQRKLVLLKRRFTGNVVQLIF
jgi:hypothetical protein